MDRSNLGELRTRHWERLQDLADRFEEAFKSGTPVEIGKYLPAVDDPLRPAALHELVKTDLEMRWRRGQGRSLEDYLRQFPELGKPEKLSPRFIFEEFRARQLYGDKPALTEYARRFPNQFAELEKMSRELMTQAPTEPPAQATVQLASEAKPKPPAPPTTTSKGGDTKNSHTRIIQTQIGYKLIKKIGTGGFAEVYQAEAPGGFPVAIKRVFRPIDSDEAQRELQSLEQIKTLRHLFLLQTQAYYLIDDQLYVVMELADGTLRDRFKECLAAGLPGVPVVELIGYFREAAEALDFMHQQQMVHRDIKPHNILLLHGHVKVADFGLARMHDLQRMMMTASGSGTPAYMAPEVWKNKVSPRSDQYSLALSYAEMRLGQWPFKGRDMFAMMEDHLTGKPILDGLPQAEQDVLLRALSKNPDDRFPTCREFVAALEVALQNELGLSHHHLTSVRTGPESLHPTGLGRGSITDPNNPYATAGGGLRPTAPTGTAPLGTAWNQAAPRSRRHWLWLLPVVAAAAAAALLLLPSKPAFELAAPPPLDLHAGQVKSVGIPVKRFSSGFEIELSFAAVPDNVKVTGGVIPEGKDHFEARVEAAPDAPMGEYRIAVTAKGKGIEQQTYLPLIVQELDYVLPRTWEKAEGAPLVEVDGRLYYGKIVITRDDVKVPFVLIPKRASGDRPTFYMMEDKVWVGLFARYANDRAMMSDAWKTEPGSTNPDNPVLGVDIVDADRFARWLGGKLPTPRQWDRAAGRYEKGAGVGPFLTEGPGQVAVARKAPMPRGQALRDRSVFGCRDMAGNGLEWTANAVSGAEFGGDADQRTPPETLEKLEDGSHVTLRSARPTEPKPYEFNTNPPKMWGKGFSPPSGIGFRVVLELEP